MDSAVPIINTLYYGIIEQSGDFPSVSKFTMTDIEYRDVS
jgi:hypothetical protein